MHEGKSRDGRPLYPAFPYTEYTRVTREDADAIFAHLQALAPVPQKNPPSRINFPYDLQPLLSLWRILFKPGIFQPEPDKSASGIAARLSCRASGIAALAMPNGTP